MGRNATIPAAIKKLFPDIHPDDALYGLYRKNNSNVSELARFLCKAYKVNISPSGLWRHIERIEKDRVINRNGASNGH